MPGGAGAAIGSRSRTRCTSPGWVRSTPPVTGPIRLLTQPTQWLPRSTVRSPSPAPSTSRSRPRLTLPLTSTGMAPPTWCASSSRSARASSSSRRPSPRTASRCAPRRTGPRLLRGRSTPSSWSTTRGTDVPRSGCSTRADPRWWPGSTTSHLPSAGGRRSPEPRSWWIR